ncbi:MAG: RNB domain-containing ribonuclease [Acidimicrobiales bacterium]
MAQVVLRAPTVFRQGFDRIRREQEVPETFPAPVLAEAARARPATGDDGRRDATDLTLVAIDPAGSTDLDQAFGAQPHGDGHRVHYAIADVGDMVRPGGAVDLESRRRGVTLYSPDDRAPLHPPILSEDRISLLAGDRRPALLWTIDLDGEGRAVDWRLERSTVKVTAAVSYEWAQGVVDDTGPGGSDDAPVTGTVARLAEIGRLRQAREAARGGVSFNLPAQEIEAEGGSYVLRWDRARPIENWNAQISLLAGMVAARSLIDAGLGVLRTLPPPRSDDLARLRATAAALGLAWPDGTTYPDLVRRLDPDRPGVNTFMLQATRVLRGAGYLALGADGRDGGRPDLDDPDARHSAIASVYAHVTAPLRRLVDRFNNEILVAHFAGRTPPGWATEAVESLPAIMNDANRRQAALDRAQLDFAEAVVLASRVGETFTGLAVDVEAERSRVRVQIAEPAVAATVRVPDGSSVQLGEQVDLRLDAVDVDQGSVTFVTGCPRPPGR